MTTTTSTSRHSSSDADTGLSVVRPDGSVVRVRCSTRHDGDFHRERVPFDELERRRRLLVDRPWTMLDEHHGVTVRDVTFPGEFDGATGDVLVTGVPGAVLGCWVADCAPVVLVGSDERVAVAHAGWRGLAAGVLDVAVEALGEPLDRVVLGPVIGPCCYEFGADDLERVAVGVGLGPDEVRGRTGDGRPALDVPGAVSAFARRWGAPVSVIGGCTGCGYPGYSHRVRRDLERHVVAVWSERA